MSDKKRKTILIGITGSISAYKIADLAHLLTKKNYDVHIIMSQHATEFIPPLTLQVLTKNKVHISVMDEPEVSEIQHISLAKKTELFLIAPATANIISKLTYGLADDLISTTALALAPHIPKVIAPAMNTYMYQNNIVQHNIKQLKEYGYHMIEPKTATLACGDTGQGALADITTIYQTIENLIS